MPDTPKDTPNGQQSPVKWVSTSAAAAALGVSERTILRRAAAGKLESRKETTARGVAVEDYAVERLRGTPSDSCRRWMSF